MVLPTLDSSPSGLMSVDRRDFVKVCSMAAAAVGLPAEAAAKFADVPEDELYADLKAFVLRSAKDGDAPTGCR